MLFYVVSTTHAEIFSSLWIFSGLLYNTTGLISSFIHMFGNIIFISFFQPPGPGGIPTKAVPEDSTSSEDDQINMRPLSTSTPTTKI